MPLKLAPSLGTNAVSTVPNKSKEDATAVIVGVRFPLI